MGLEEILHQFSGRLGDAVRLFLARSMPALMSPINALTCGGTGMPICRLLTAC